MAPFEVYHLLWFHIVNLSSPSTRLVFVTREDLKDYWQKVAAIDKVMDFAKHHCSNDIKLFLQVDENTKNKVSGTSFVAKKKLDIIIRSLHFIDR